MPRKFHVLESSLLYMFLGLKSAQFRFFVYHSKSAESIPFIFAVWLVQVIMLIVE